MHQGVLLEKRALLGLHEYLTPVFLAAGAGKPVQGVPVGSQPGSSWNTDTSPGTYPRPHAPTNGQGRPPTV